MPAAVAYTDRVAAIVKKQDPDIPPVKIAVILPVATNEKGELVSPDVAAERIIGILGQSRTVTVGSSNQNGGTSKKIEPLGELVSVDLELVGLRGQPVFLSWSIFQNGGQNSLYGKWLNDIVAYRLQATTDDDTGTLEMWIPLPKAPGQYFLRLNLTTGGSSLASADSGLFG